MRSIKKKKKDFNIYNRNNTNGKKPSTNKTQGLLLETILTSFRFLSRYTNILEEYLEPEIWAPNSVDQTIKKYWNTKSSHWSAFLCVCSYCRLTPSSSSSELSKMLSKSWREGAKSVTCVRLLEPALPAALSCRTSVGRRQKAPNEQLPQRRRGEERAVSKPCLPTASLRCQSNRDTISAKYTYQFWKNWKTNYENILQMRSNHCYYNQHIMLNREASSSHLF